MKISPKIGIDKPSCAKSPDFVPINICHNLFHLIMFVVIAARSGDHRRASRF